MIKSKKSNILLIGLKSSISFIGCILFTFCAISFFVKHTTIKEKRFSKYLAESRINIFASNMNAVQYAAIALDTIISHDEKIPDNIDEIINTQLLNHSFINSIFIAPDGQIEKVFPYSGRDNLFINLFAQEQTKSDFERIKRTHKSTLIGQVPLRTGYDGFIYVHPVYNHDKSFWGFVIYTLESHDLLFAADMQSIANQNYRYQFIFKGINKDYQGQVIYSSVNDKLLFPVKYEFSAADNFWSLNLEPVNGWCNRVIIFIFVAIAVILSIFVLSLVILLYYFQDRDRALELLSSKDPLTNLYNIRTYSTMLTKFRENGTKFGLLNIDVNDFKMINDTYGHCVGDMALTIAAKKIQNCIREEDFAFRTGGDEFAIVVKDIIDRGFYDTLKSRLKNVMNSKIYIKEQDLYITLTLSIGFSIFPNDSAIFDDIIRIADKEMYKDKRLQKVIR